MKTIITSICFVLLLAQSGCGDGTHNTDGITTTTSSDVTLSVNGDATISLSLTGRYQTRTKADACRRAAADLLKLAQDYEPVVPPAKPPEIP